MKRLRVIIWIIGFMVVGSTPSVAGQIPDSVNVYLPAAGSFLQSGEWTGSMTSDGITVTWNVSDFAADFMYSGTMTGFGIAASCGFELTWLDTGATLPVSVSFASNTAGPYDINPMVQGTSGGPEFWWDPIEATGNSYFGHYFPPVYKVHLLVWQFVQWGDPVDLTVTMEWGPGVPVESATWGGVKSLYR